MKKGMDELPAMVELMYIYVTEKDPLKIAQLDEIKIAPPTQTNLISFTQSEELRNRVIAGYEHCNDFEKYYTVLRDNLKVPKTMKNSIKNYQLVNGILYFNHDATDYHRVCVPSTDDLRKLVIRQTHDTLTGGHRGKFPTLAAIRKNFYWPNMDTTVHDYIRRCQVCQMTKQKTTPTAGLFLPLPIPEGRWTDITMDFVGPFPVTERGNDSMLVVVDRATKHAHFIATKKQLSSAETAQLFLDNVFRHHGIPNNIVSDRDIRFTARFWQTLHEQ
ncbi:unnamed protein product [[Candida] boidinii]|nr:unnamed protein product [[Candida] boidinii]